MKKFLMAMLALSLVIFATVAGTVAYLTDKTDPVTNTFTAGKVDIDLYETDEAGKHIYENEYLMLPGSSYKKDPTVEVAANSEDCWLFVMFEETNVAGTGSWFHYTSNLTADKGWFQGDGTDIPENVWYRPVLKSAEERSWELLAGNTVSFDGDGLRMDNMPDAAPQLKYTAFACQRQNGPGTFTAQEAWNKVKP